MYISQTLDVHKQPNNPSKKQHNTRSNGINYPKSEIYKIQLKLQVRQKIWTKKKKDKLKLIRSNKIKQEVANQI